MPDSNLIVVAAVGIGIILVIVILVMISTRRKLARGDRTIRASRPLPTKKGHTFKDGTLTITSRKSTPDSKRYIGKIIGDWKIMGRIGGGGMATVYKAMGIGEDNLDIVAALKIPSEQFIHITQRG
jgi:hypothetical protein